MPAIRAFLRLDSDRDKAKRKHNRWRALKATNVGIPIPTTALLVLQEDLDCLDEFLGDSMEESILGVDVVLDQKFYHFQVLVIDRHQQSRASQRVHAVDVYSGFAGRSEHPETIAVQARANSGSLFPLV